MRAALVHMLDGGGAVLLWARKVEGNHSDNLARPRLSRG